MPVIPTDVAPPTDRKLGLIAGPHTRQFWDPSHLVSGAFLAAGRAHVDRLQPKERDRLEQTEVAWDLAAVFPPGVSWETEVPWPSYWGGPVVNVIHEIGAQLPF